MKQPKYYKNQLTFADLGVKDRRKKITDELLAQMKELRKNKISYQKIAKQFNVSYNFVYLNLNRNYYENKFKKIQKRHYNKLKANNKITICKRNIFNSIQASTFKI